MFKIYNTHKPQSSRQVLLFHQSFDMKHTGYFNKEHKNQVMPVVKWLPYTSAEV